MRTAGVCAGGGVVACNAAGARWVWVRGHENVPQARAECEQRCATAAWGLDGRQSGIGYATGRVGCRRSSASLCVRFPFLRRL